MRRPGAQQDVLDLRNALVPRSYYLLLAGGLSLLPRETHWADLPSAWETLLMLRHWLAEIL
jgi:hypothetical protein